MISNTFPLLFLLVGTGISYGIYSFGSKSLYDERIAIVKQWDLQWGFLSALLLSVLVAYLNYYPLRFKGAIMLASSANLRANQFIYVNAAEGSNKGRVILIQEGDEGLYNRANRTLHHFVENSIHVVLAIGLCSFVFPFPTFVLASMIIVFRLIYTVSYTNGGYGLHFPGFFAFTFTVNALNGLLLITAIKAMQSSSDE